MEEDKSIYNKNWIYGTNNKKGTNILLYFINNKTNLLSDKTTKTTKSLKTTAGWFIKNVKI